MNQEPFEPDFDKIKFLMGTLLVCALAGLPIAYFAGGTRTEGLLRLEMEQELHAVETKMTQELSVVRIDQTKAIDQLREEIGILNLKQERMSLAVTDDLKNAGIEVKEIAPAKTEAVLKPESIVAMITDGQIEQLVTTLSYNRVVEIIGREGELTMEMEDAGGSTLMYTWTWIDADNIAKKLSLQFVSDQLVSTTLE
jgi:hypothetical protein